MQLGLYLQPEPPIPEFITKDWCGDVIYGWLCDKDGIAVYGESKTQAISNWEKAHREEYQLQ